MKIDVVLLEKNLNILLKIEEKYQENYLNYYNEFNKLVGYWNTTKGVSFLENIKDEKGKIDLYYSYFNDIRDVYKYLIIEYKKIGEKIFYNLDERDNIKNQYNLYLEKINYLIEKLDNINISNIDNKISNSVYNGLLGLNNISKSISDIVQKFDSINDQLDNILIVVENKVNKIDINTIKLLDESEYYKRIGFNKNNNVVVDADKLENVTNIIKNLIFEEEIILDDLKNSYSDINNCFLSRLDNKFSAIENILIDSLVKIKNNHVIEADLLLKEVNDVRILEKEMIKSMSSLGDSN